MKKTAAFLLFLIPVLGWGQSFDSIVNFGIELSSLSDPAVVGRIMDDGRVVILEGLMADSEKFESAEGNGVVVTMIGGEWIGTSEVRAYSCRILFSGDQWAKRFSEDGDIPAGSRLLAAVRVTGFDTEDDVPEARMVSFRILQ
jgi:hypothetical protein